MNCREAVAKHLKQPQDEICVIPSEIDELLTDLLSAVHEGAKAEEECERLRSYLESYMWDERPNPCDAAIAALEAEREAVDNLVKLRDEHVEWIGEATDDMNELTAENERLKAECNQLRAASIERAGFWAKALEEGGQARDQVERLKAELAEAREDSEGWKAAGMKALDEVAAQKARIAELETAMRNRNE